MLKSIRRKLHLDNYKLETVARACNIEISNLHRALADCELIYRINNGLNIFWNNVSINTHYFMIFLVYSPHTRGWTRHMIKIIKTYQIFPAYAGLNLVRRFMMRSLEDIPRIRGVEPTMSTALSATKEYSPHTRGWTCVQRGKRTIGEIFPAYAGLNLLSPSIVILLLNIPRIRGVEPLKYWKIQQTMKYSPHTRGWT